MLHPTRGMCNDERMAEYLFSGNHLMATSSFCFSRSLANRAQFDETYRKHEDYGFLFQCEAAGAEFHYIDIPLCVREYRMAGIHAGQSLTPSFSVNWLTKHAEYFTERSRTGFLYLHVLDDLVKMNWTDRLKEILKATFSAFQSTRYLALLISTMLPHRSFARIKYRMLGGADDPGRSGV